MMFVGQFWETQWFLKRNETYGLLHFICTKVSVKTQSQIFIVILILPVLLSELFYFSQEGHSHN